MTDDVYNVVTTINGEIEYALDAIETFLKQNMLLNAIEAEGYLRACLTIKDELSVWHESFRKAFNSDPDS